MRRLPPVFPRWTALVVAALACRLMPLWAAAPAVESQAKPDTALFVRTKPSGADVRLDGKPLGQSNGLFLVAPGVYQLTVELPGHQPHEQSVTIHEGRITRIDLTLKQRLPVPGSSARPRPGPQNSINHSESPDDAKLNEGQRLYRDWTEAYFSGFLDATRWQNLSPMQKSGAEPRLLKDLGAKDIAIRIQAINGLAVLGSPQAVPGLLRIAAEPRDKDDRERWMAIRALGLLGDRSVVPKLVHLTYHYNQNSRFWAQISLVRLTGQTFGDDLAAWKQWGMAQGLRLVISDQKIIWTTKAEWANPTLQQQMDARCIENLKRAKSSATSASQGQSSGK